MARVHSMEPRVVDPRVVLFAAALTGEAGPAPAAAWSNARVMTVDKAGAHVGRVICPPLHGAALVRFDNHLCAWVDTPLLRIIPERN